MFDWQFVKIRQLFPVTNFGVVFPVLQTVDAKSQANTGRETVFDLPALRHFNVGEAARPFAGNGAVQHVAVVIRYLQELFKHLLVGFRPQQRRSVPGFFQTRLLVLVGIHNFCLLLCFARSAK